MAGILWTLSMATIVAAVDLGGGPTTGLAIDPAAPSVGATGAIGVDWAAGLPAAGAVSLEPAPGPRTAQPAWVPPREGRALQQACREALRRWARPGEHEVEAATRELLALHAEVERDTQLAVSQREELRLSLRGRLARLAERLRRQATVAGDATAPVRPESIPESIVVAPGDDVLAQWGGMGGGGGWGGMGGPQGAMPGGAGWGMIGPQGGFAAEPADNGQQLVELIEKTIAPRTWVTNGGLGSIYYWRPGRAIVVRQNQEVHGQIGDLLWQMQQLGQ